jgi:DNA-directed RNA polymerase subunit E'/Rpb7
MASSVASAAAAAGAATAAGATTKGEPLTLNESYLTRALLVRRIFLPMRQVNGDLDRILFQTVVNEIEGKCIREGFVQPQSVEIKQYSSGTCKADQVAFDVTLTCLVFLPVKGMLLPGRVTNKTLAGICATLDLANSQPAIMFVARDHHLADPQAYEQVKIGDVITVECIGERFQLNDTYIRIMALLTPASNTAAE